MKDQDPSHVLGMQVNEKTMQDNLKASISIEYSTEKLGNENSILTCDVPDPATVRSKIISCTPTCKLSFPHGINARGCLPLIGRQVEFEDEGGRWGMSLNFLVGMVGHGSKNKKQKIQKYIVNRLTLEKISPRR